MSQIVFIPVGQHLRGVRIPANLRFRQRDLEGPWFMGQDSWDLIHLGMLCGSVLSWQELYGNVYQ